MYVVRSTRMFKFMHVGMACQHMMRILGWTVGRSQDKGFGGTVCVAFCLLAAQDPGLDHGCWNPASLLTALCHSNSGRSILQQALVASNSLKRAHKAALQKGAKVAAFQVAAAALGSGVPNEVAPEFLQRSHTILSLSVKSLTR